MFFPNKIVSIKELDRVLEVGPGGSPHHRSDVLLEKIFDENEAREQRGHAKELKTTKKLVFYEGNIFPFDDNEFDYVICSHVLEHIKASEIKQFLSEIQRVGKKGYLEFPTIYYDYIYNFPKHLTFLLYEHGTIKFLGKENTQLDTFKAIQSFFYNSAIAGHTSLTDSLKDYFFQGFEWHDYIKCKEVKRIEDITYPKDISKRIPMKSSQAILYKQKVFNKLNRIWKYINRNFQIYILQDKFLKAHKQWVADDGDKKARLNYNLTSSSIVFDLGGYKGDFAHEIFQRYKSNIYIFEPVKSFYDEIVERFKGNSKIKVFNCGLSNENYEATLNLNEDGSSIFTHSENKEKIFLKNITLFLREENIDQIDLFKINIEGGEFEVLPVLLESGFINNIKDLQIQFHTFIKNAKLRRNEIRKKLLKTHKLTYDYWFVWENWTLRKENDKKHNPYRDK